MMNNSNLSASTHLNYNEGPVPNYTPENLSPPYTAGYLETERDYGGKEMSGEGSYGLFLDMEGDEARDRKIWHRFSAEAETLLFATASRLALGPIQPPIQWI
jgi:hypothetical protein